MKIKLLFTLLIAFAFFNGISAQTTENVSSTDIANARLFSTRTDMVLPEGFPQQVATGNVKTDFDSYNQSLSTWIAAHPNEFKTLLNTYQGNNNINQGNSNSNLTPLEHLQLKNEKAKTEKVDSPN